MPRRVDEATGEPLVPSDELGGSHGRRILLLASAFNSLRMSRLRRPPGGSSARARTVRRTLVLSAVVLLLAPTQALGAPGGGAGQRELESQLLKAVRDARFAETIDFGPFEDACPGAPFCPVPAQPVKHMPNIDVAVIELDAAGNAVRAANVLVSRDFPSGVVAPIDGTAGPAGSWGVSGVRWRRWDIDRYNGGTFDQHNGKQLTVKGWTDNPALTEADDVVPGRESAPMSSWPRTRRRCSSSS